METKKLNSHTKLIYYLQYSNCVRMFKNHICYDTPIFHFSNS